MNDVTELCKIQADTNEKQTDYYFFSRKDKKYPTGNRANRATTKGFWKATGRDKPIYTKLQTLIGMRKTLVFYEGRAPHGVKTDWIMHEFRLDDGPGRPAHVTLDPLLSSPLLSSHPTNSFSLQCMPASYSHNPNSNSHLLF
jgi:hypothetical protein